MFRLRRAVLVAVVAAVLGPAVLAGVRVVGPGQPYTQISAAVAAASDGDIILVKSGGYDGFTIANKSLAVVVDVGAFVYVDGAIHITDLVVSKTVVLDRLIMISNGGANFDGLDVQSCGGPVRVQGCKFTAAGGNASINHSTCDEVGVKDGGVGIRVQDATDVALVACEAYGGTGSDLWDYNCYWSSYEGQIGGDGGAGLEVTGSRVTVYDCTFRGGDAGDGAYAGDAGLGIACLERSSIVLVSSSAQGGHGGINQDPLTGKSGAHGIASDGSSDLSILESQFEGGLGGGQTASPADFGAAPTWWNGPAKSLGFIKLLREGQSTPIGVSGEPGDIVLLMAATKTSAFTFNQFKGTLALDPSPLLGPFALGVISQDVLNVVVNMPHLPPAVPALEVYLQGLVKSAGGGSTLTAWGHLTLLDSSY